MSVNAVCVCVLVNAGGYMPLHTRGWGQSPVSVHVFYLVWDRVSFAVTFARLLGPCTSRDSPVCSPFPCRNTGQQTRNGFMSSGFINANPQACKANTSCPEPSPQLKFVFSLFVLYSMYVEITQIPGIKLRSPQAWQLPNWAILSTLNFVSSQDALKWFMTLNITTVWLSCLKASSPTSINAKTKQTKKTTKVKCTLTQALEAKAGRSLEFDAN